jgi:glycosyltransferase involved in cell wall biosynthesis
MERQRRGSCGSMNLRSGRSFGAPAEGTGATLSPVVAISVVLPVYNCSECLRPLHSRLVATLQELASSYEIIFVDDRGPDDAWDVLWSLAAEDPAVRVLRLSRNFGQHAAITAGVDVAQGDWVVLMDCDLQDAPEDIAHLFAETQKGHDIVFSRRLRRNQSLFRRIGARLYFRLRNALLKMDMDEEHGSLMLFSRSVADAFRRVRDRDRHHALILHWLGFNPAMVALEHGSRFAGKSSYTFRKLLSVAVEGMFFQTTVLLRWIVYLGFVVALAGCVLAAVLITIWAVADPPAGWTSLGVLILVMSGFIIASTGVAGLYIGKIFEQVKNRPLYVVERELAGGVIVTDARTEEVPRQLDVLHRK